MCGGMRTTAATVVVVCCCFVGGVDSVGARRLSRCPSGPPFVRDDDGINMSSSRRSSSCIIIVLPDDWASLPLVGCDCGLCSVD